MRRRRDAIVVYQPTYLPRCKKSAPASMTLFDSPDMFDMSQASRLGPIMAGMLWYLAASLLEDEEADIVK